MTPRDVNVRVADELLKIANGIMAGKIAVMGLNVVIRDHSQKFTDLYGNTQFRRSGPVSRELNFSYTEHK